MMYLKRSQKGLSLVELMVAIVIGLLLVAGVTQLFANNRLLYSAHENQSRIQENARYTLQVLTEAIQRAGYMGCATRNASDIINTLSNTPVFTERFEDSIQGNRAVGGSWSPPPDSSISSPLTGNDIITVRTGIGSSMRVLAHNSATQRIELGSNHGLENGNIVMVSDCINAVILRVADVDGNNITYDNSIELQLDISSAQITRMVTRSFYIRTNPDGFHALYERINNESPQELVSGIENLQILYGEDTNQDGSVDVYVPANAVGNWRNILSVEVSLDAIATGDNVVPAISGGTVEQLTTSYQKTIALRGRLP